MRLKSGMCNIRFRVSGRRTRRESGMNEQPTPLGERVAIPQARESQVRGYLLMSGPLIPLCRASHPSPGSAS
jgi:hypothetical protein